MPAAKHKGENAIADRTEQRKSTLGGKPTSDLQIRLARELIGLAVDGTLQEGDHLREIDVSKRFNVSRTPLRATLDLLVRDGLVEKRCNRGFFWVASKSESRDFLTDFPKTEDENLYERIARDWFEGKIDKEVSEAEIRKRYRLGRLTAQRILNGLSEQGVVSRLPGYGWQFEPTLNTLAAHDESYDFRVNLECGTLRRETFNYREKAGRALRHRHEAVLQSKVRKHDLPDLFRLDADFHDFIAECSNNRFVAQAISQQNRLRRLLEYNSLIDAGRLIDSCREHLEILDKIESGDMEGAAICMLDHLTKAKRSKPAFIS